MYSTGCSCAEDERVHRPRSSHAFPLQLSNSREPSRFGHTGPPLTYWIGICLFLLLSSLLRVGAIHSHKLLAGHSALSIRSVLAADVDGDGLIDVMSASQNDGKLAWYRNLGQGHFALQQVLTNLESLLSFKVGDFNNDGILDVVCIQSGFDKLTWHLGEGGGAFTSSKFLDLPHGFEHQEGLPESLQVVDLNRDGWLDILVANRKGSSVWFANREGTGFESVEFSSQSSAVVVPGNFSNQDRPGIILVRESDPNQIIWLQYGDSGSYDTQYTGTISGDLSVLTAAAADLNQDGREDVVLGARSEVLWFENLGNGALSPATTITTQTNRPKCMFLFDINGDGMVDILTGSQRNIIWFLNDGTGSFPSRIYVATDIGGDVNAVSGADLDGDGLLDVIAGLDRENLVVWYKNRGNGNYDEARDLSSPLVDIESVYLADLNNDGYLDILYADKGAGLIGWFMFMDTGLMVHQPLIAKRSAKPSFVIAADLNGDGFMDILSTSSSGNEIAWYANQGNGSFSEANVIGPNILGPSSVVACDINQDGLLDVVSASAGDDTISSFLNLDDGRFSDRQIVGSGVEGASSVCAADLNNDGYPDIISGAFDGSKVSWFQNKGDGTFRSESVVSTSLRSATGVSAMDLDGDGWVDILSASMYDAKVAWYGNNGDGTFSSQQVLLDDMHWASFVTVGDLNNDGNPDVVASAEYRQRVSWVAGDGKGGFSPEKILDEGFTAMSVALGDINMDGYVEVVVASPDNDAIMVYDLGDVQESEPAFCHAISAVPSWAQYLNWDEKCANRLMPIWDGLILEHTDSPSVFVGTGLDLSGLGLSSAVPAELSALDKMYHLDLSNNSLSNGIESLASWDSLSSLTISWNKLSAVPEEWTALTSLSSLDLSLIMMP